MVGLDNQVLTITNPTDLLSIPLPQHLISEIESGLALIVYKKARNHFCPTRVFLLYWNYDYDETMLILEGSIVLENENMPPTRHGPGDVIFFKNGARAKWHVESRVRKLAFCRTAQPLLVSFVVRALSKIKRIALSRKTKTERLTA